MANVFPDSDIRIALKLALVVMLCLVTVPAGRAEEGRCLAVEVDGDVIGHDDLGGSGLPEALRASLDFLAGQPAERSYRLCDRTVTVEEIRSSLATFLELHRREGNSPGFPDAVKKRFSLYGAAGPAGSGRVMVTGYFEPLLEGSLSREPPYIHPLYRAPADLVQRGGEVGRIDNGRLVPYWSRAMIEERGLLAGSELVYVRDPVEAFVLHVQGSGRIRLRDGTVRRIQFAAKNGLPYRSIGRLLVERGKMDLERVSLPAIIDYLAAHPEEQREIFHHNESFVFFRWGETGDEGPLGSIGEPLTAGRSVAIDRDVYPPGGVAFLRTRKPLFDEDDRIIGWEPLLRFVTSQDSGSAIKGPGRVDLFLGSGGRARTTAGVMKNPGRLYFLLKKK